MTLTVAAHQSIYQHKMPENRSEICIVVSFYDARPNIELIKLLRQLNFNRSSLDFELRVVVNSDAGIAPCLPSDLAQTDVVVRENTGFNIGAWDYGWRANPGFSSYIFLQDECEINHPYWLLRYKKLLSDNDAGLVGESLILWKSWPAFSSMWPEASMECLSIAERRGIELGKSPTHLQTLALGATGTFLSRTDGFLVANEKVQAIATEIMFSRLCVARGFKMVQSSWRPFAYISHPQWSSLRANSASIKWNIFRALNFMRSKLAF